VNSIDKLKDSSGIICRDNIKLIIPYGDEFLFLDRILKLDKKKLSAEMFVTEGASYLKGHFRDFPIMPGALIVEGLGQAATVLIRYNLERHEEKDILAFKINNAKFFRPTFPGHTLRFETRLLFMFKKLAFVNGKVFRKEKLVCKANMVLAIVDKAKFRERYQKKAN
jgi:3-hydroxymyristoyl/3-hydroxydecanoyl-(acyl carrier protein) dehydratase